MVELLVIAGILALAVGVPFMMRRSAAPGGAHALGDADRRERRRASGRAKVRTVRRTGLSIVDQ